MTRATDDRPTKRLLQSLTGDDYVVELRARLVTIRPKGTRRGGRAEVSIPPGAIWQSAFVARVERERREKRALRKKGHSRA